MSQLPGRMRHELRRVGGLQRNPQTRRKRQRRFTRPVFEHAGLVVQIGAGESEGCGVAWSRVRRQARQAIEADIAADMRCQQHLRLRLRGQAVRRVVGMPAQARRYRLFRLVGDAQARHGAARIERDLHGQFERPGPAFVVGAMRMAQYRFRGCARSTRWAARSGIWPIAPI